MLYKRQSSSRRARRHRRVAEKLLQLFAGREQDVAAEIATHFEAAGDWALAADALMTSAMAYLNRGDQEEALLLMRQAAGLLENLPERERAESIANIHKQISSIDKRRVTALSA